MNLKLFGEPEVTPRMQRLKQLSLFASLSNKDLRIVSGLLHEREYVPDEVIFDEGEEGQALYIVESGKVHIRRHGLPGNGLIAELGAGQFFGDLALLDKSPRSAQARAAEPSVLAVFFRDDFLSLLETHAVIASRVSLELARHIGLRLREATRQQASTCPE